MAPVVSKGFYSRCQDIKATKRFVVYPGGERYPLTKEREVLSVHDIVQEVATL